MTVTLSEEEKEVVGVGPDNPRFIQIKEEFMQFVDENDLNEWKNQAEKHILDHEMNH